MQKNIKNRALEKAIKMLQEQLPLFKELVPYSGKIDLENRWIKMAEMVPWDELTPIYNRYFDRRRLKVVKSCQLIMGLMIGQMILKLSDRDIVSFFHENPYFQYFCGQTTFLAKVKRRMIHPTLLSHRRRRLGAEYVKAFESEILTVLQKKGVIKGKTLMLDATVFEATITYPNDIKLINTVREWGCKTILTLKNMLDPSQKIRTMKKTGRKVYLGYQKTRRRTVAFIRKTRNQLLRFTKRNIEQLTHLVAKATASTDPMVARIRSKIEARLSVAKLIYSQQLAMATTKGRRVANRIVSFSQPLVRPIIRGKERGKYEFGIKAHVALVDGVAFLDRAQSDPFHEGNCLPESVAHYIQRFGESPERVIADQLYATRANRLFLKEQGIQHAFKPMGRPPDTPDHVIRSERAQRKKYQSSRNQIEATFGHLKSRFNLNRTSWTVPDGPESQIRLALIAFNLHRAFA